MNKIVKSINEEGNFTYRLICESGEEFVGDRWFEKKTGKYHIRLPKNNPSGRQYIREDLFNEKSINDEFEFETKTTHRTGMTYSSKLTDAEKSQIDEFNRQIDEIKVKIKAIKDEASKRVLPKIDKNSDEWIENQLKALLEEKARRDALKAAKAAEAAK